MKKILLVVAVVVAGFVFPTAPASANVTQWVDVPGPFSSQCHVFIEQNYTNYNTGTPVRKSYATPTECIAHAMPWQESNDAFYVLHTVRLTKSPQPAFTHFPLANHPLVTGTTRHDLDVNHTLYSPNGQVTTLLAVCDSRPNPDACGFPVEYFKTPPP